MDRFGLIAGSGPLPFLFARENRSKGHAVVAAAYEGETDEGLEDYVEDLVRIKLGELGKTIEFFKRRRVNKVIMLGAIDKKKMMNGRVHLDERALSVLARLKEKGDDALLVALAEELGREGMEVVSQRDFLSAFLLKEGVIGSRAPEPNELADISTGIRLLERLSPEDVGQAVVVKDGVILAVEAVEGTDAAIRRGGELGGPGAVVVKGAKAGQDLRFDLPTVGPGTIEAMRDAKARVLAAQAGKSLVMELSKMLSMADAEGIAVMGWTGEQTHVQA